MLKVSYIDFRGTSVCASRSGWYITDGNGAMVGGAQRYEDRASGLRALSALSA